MAFQNRRFGCVQPCSQFLRVPRLTPSFAANVIVEKPDSSLYFISDSAKDWVLFWQGGESTLTALITRWQKGFRNHRIRTLISDDNLSQKGNDFGFVAF